jgi:hypothetical protein
LLTPDLLSDGLLIHGISSKGAARSVTSPPMLSRSKINWVFNSQ